MQATVIQDSHEAAAVRAERAARSERYLREVEREQARFSNVQQMLGFFFVMREHMASAPAIDPSREQIQGGEKRDRDETIAWVGKIHRALRDLAISDGTHERPIDAGVFLLWSVHRVGEQTPIRELYRVDPLKRSRRRAEAAYWDAVEWLEDYAGNRGWVRERVRRERRAEQTYRRGDA